MRERERERERRKNRAVTQQKKDEVGGIRGQGREREGGCTERNGAER